MSNFAYEQKMGNEITEDEAARSWGDNWREQPCIVKMSHLRLIEFIADRKWTVVVNPNREVNHDLRRTD